MHDLVKLAMRGPKQAIMLAAVSMLIPMMFWFGAAIVGLVVLRQGLYQGLNVFAWAAIPGLGWWIGMKDPGAFVVLSTVMVMAVILRHTVSWQYALVGGALVSLLVGSLAQVIMPEMIALLVEMTQQMSAKIAEESGQTIAGDVDGILRSVLIAGFAVSFYGMSIASLCLARSWQSKLYNPGGWKAEFHALRLNSKTSLIILALYFILPLLGLDPALVMMLMIVPLLFIGLALIHGVVAKKKLGKHWLVMVYLSSIFLFPTVLVLIALAALIDSMIDIRARIQAT